MPYDQYGYSPYPPQQYQQNTYAFVNGVEGAKSFIVKPNQTVLLMDSEQPVCYMKASNGFGQATLRYFKLVEVKEEELKQPSVSDTIVQRLEQLEKVVFKKEE